MLEKTLHFESSRLINQLYCGKEENLDKVERALQVKITTREGWLQICGEEKSIETTATFFNLLNKGKSQGMIIRNNDFENLLKSMTNGNSRDLQNVFDQPTILKFKRLSIIAKTLNQKNYLNVINNNDIVFGIGPAGTGKTYLAVASAIDSLLKHNIEKLILTRPAVEAGEALGFLPGDLNEKILPYLRPLYDAMNEILGKELSQKLIDNQTIEIAPLAYMRGRTLSNALIILDEAQNTSPEQMLMFLTRLGEGSRMIITGDITQVDLPNSKSSGLKEARKVLHKTNGIQFFYFNESDIVRHPLVQDIIESYNNFR